MGALQRLAVERLIAKATELGVPTPGPLSAFVCGSGSTYAARAYAAAHPELIDADGMVIAEAICCAEVGYTGSLEECSCWTPIWEPAEQAPPRPPESAAELQAQPSMCGDCAFRPGSPERETEYEEETLLSLPESGTPFWCHDRMRRPARWVHPTRGEIEGDPGDWQPPQLGGIPYRADGSPGLLCAGWLALRLKAVAR